MGSACCVAARDRTITNGASSEVLQRNVRYSPSWSFRWDNRGRVAGEETSVNCFSDGISRTDGSDVKSGATVETVYASEEGSPVDSFRTLAWQKSPISERNSGILRLPSSDQSNSRNFPTEVKEPTESPRVSDPSSTKLSPSVHSISPLSTSPLSSRNHLLRPTSTPSRLPRCHPGHQLLRQVSDARIPGHKSQNLSISEESSFLFPGWSNESTGGSNLGSSDGWSIPAFSDLMATPRRERWSFDSESLGFDPEKTRSSGQLSVSPSIDVRTCGVCSKLLTEKSSWGSQKIIATNELAVVAILICGHVYHAECLESMTPEINKYDPACPVCTFGEKQVLKLSEKALRAEMDSKARNKRSRNQIVSRDLDGDSVVFDGQKSSGHGGKGLKLISSSSMKSSLGKPFLRQHFSFGSKGTRSLSVNHSTRKKGFFWSKSSKD
ncbi:E3 ubiquitin-protein like [Actinidia chinensis var. chinensis]|uniref:E3 ubiquitin-protein like n=1 Tax=Actinidia chinensis var. chinensis TaxID=1590841 RepID=A0A2R6RHG0_ACTCC|nr:E3 ubiquitin-protein like [Actinidia chinensis var. chinensis]